MKVSPARRAAFEILRRIEDGAYSSVLLAVANDDLSAKDRTLCHELVLGVLRRRLWLDQSLNHFADRRVEDLDLPVVLALRLGLYQLRFLSRIPPSAAVNESVNLIRAARLKSASSFVNAVLRRATREPDYDPAAGVNDQIEKLAIETSHPTWLIERWRSEFGFAESTALARANTATAPPAFRFTAKALLQANRNPAQIIAQLRAAGAELLQSKIAPGAWRVIRRNTRSESAGTDAGVPHAGMRALLSALLRQLSEEGLIYFQDEASQLVAHLLAARAGDRVLDVCAAPGSKSTLIAALAPKASIVAGDLHEHRVRTISELAQRQQATNIQLVVHDATGTLPFTVGSFDRVLVDAPCSGTGTLRQNPEIRWRLQSSDIAELVVKQERILESATAMVRPGGLLIYSTCSLETDENEAVVNDFLDQHPEFAKARLELPPDLLTDSGAIRTWPHRDDTDGFFMAALRRKD
jgi:16S rRNA (cytosine967-C5)-methyltransferase